MNCFIILIINVAKMLILTLSRKKWPHHWISCTSINYISATTWSSALTKACLWSTNNCNASWTVNGCQGPWQGMKPASDKARIVLLIPFILVKTFISSQLESMCFWVQKKGIDGRANQFEKTPYTS